MLTLQSIHADIKTGVGLTRLPDLCVFEGPNGSGKSAVLQAIDLLVNGQAADLRGKDRKAAYYLSSLLSSGKTGAIVIDGGLSNGAAVSCVAANGHTALSWPDGMRDEHLTDLWRVAYQFIDTSSPVEWVKLMARIGRPEWADVTIGLNRDHDSDVAFCDYSIPGVQLIVQEYEELLKVFKAAKAKFVGLKEDREVLRKHKAFDAIMATDAKITEAEAVCAAAKKSFDAVDVKLKTVARDTAVAFDAFCASMMPFAELRDRFGMPGLAAGVDALPAFSDGFPCPYLSKTKNNGWSMPEHSYALSGAEEVFVAMWVANGLAALNIESCVRRRKSPPYMAFIAPDRDYDDDFIRRLSSATANMQIFIAKSKSA